MADANNYLLGNSGRAGAGFNSFAAGKKVYEGSRSAPNVGPVRNKSGYQKRDRQVALQRNALLKKLQAKAGKRPMSPDALRGVRGGGNA